MSIEKLEQIWLVSNNLTEFYPLIKFANLEKIVLKDNLICNIEKLVDFVHYFNQLKKIDFSENKIDKNDKDITKIVEEASEVPKTKRIVEAKENNEKNQDSKKEEIIEKIKITI